MTNVIVSTIGATPLVIPPADLEALKGALRGVACTPIDEGYDEARTIWNAMIDRRPGLIVRCAGAADVMQAVELRARARAGRLGARRRPQHRRQRGLRRRPDDRPVADEIGRVDAAAKRHGVEPGATLADVDRETQAFGLVCPTGINSTTGIAGLTLGGGFGWLTRRFGMTIDNLISADVVTADGRLRARQRQRRTRTCSGRSAAAAAISAWSPNFEFQLQSLGRRCFQGWSCIPSPMPRRS